MRAIGGVMVRGGSGVVAQFLRIEFHHVEQSHYLRDLVDLLLIAD